MAPSRGKGNLEVNGRTDELGTEGDRADRAGSRYFCGLWVPLASSEAYGPHLRLVS